MDLAYLRADDAFRIKLLVQLAGGTALPLF